MARAFPAQAIRLVIFAGLIALFSGVAASGWAQEKKAIPGSLATDLRDFVAARAVPGYERALAAELQQQLKAFSPTTDHLGDVIVNMGKGSPRRLIVAPMDEPGYVVSGITDDGYLRLERLPQFTLLPLFNELYSAQPVGIETAFGRWIPGVVAGLSVHLLPGRPHPPNPEDIGNMYVDVGAQSATGARGAGADLLDPVVIDRTLYNLGGSEWAGAAVGDRFGDAALVEMLRQSDPAKIQGQLIVAFVAQQWTGARGLERLLTRYKPDELIYVGRLIPGGSELGTRPPQIPSEPPGSGVLFGTEKPSAPVAGLDAELQSLAHKKEGIPTAEDFSAALMPPSYLPAPSLPARTTHLAIATAWPSTPAETISQADLSNLVMLLEDYLQGSSVKPEFPAAETILEPSLPARPASAPSPQELAQDLTQAYGVSGHEAAVRETIARLLPEWAKPTTDDAGNLILHLASGSAGSGKAPIVFDAHMDEIGYQVKSISADGKLEVESEGGGIESYYLGHVCFVHTSEGIRPGVMELPKGWQEVNFKWPRGRELTAQVDVGATTADDAKKLGVQVGDFITVQKTYRRLIGTRATVRSFDDRDGDAALIAAVWALGPNLKNRNVTFMWSTEEELGLVGASKAAARWAAEGKAPAYIFAVDTFVSSDSPLESKRFADAKLGDGFVIRAVDNSNIVPRNLVEKVLRLASENHIPAQYGATGGGNNGSAFLRYGTTDVALGWPLRYSHSPAEEIDTRDLDALSRILAAIAREW